ncbi:hypothetical protein OG225_07365 [Nocardia sp. NBC_01377]|uniref:hypothetical protein n=1 Tax=Nocardia sp. NBC_01377 TaxID=2903595 RepID=UPI00324C178F
MAPNEPNKPADLQMPDTTGKKEGDTWKVTENGVEVTYTIPAGNGNQSVDRTWTNSAGGTSTNRMVDDGAGGFQSWTDSTNGPATYMNKGQGGTTDGVYGQVYDPGNSTSGAADVGFGGNPNLSQVEAVRYDENGNPVDRLNSSRNSRGNWDSVGFDSEGNRTLFGDIPDGKGGFVQGALVGQVNQEGYGWSTDPEGTRWNIAPDPSGDPGALLHWRTETTKDSNTLSIYVDSRGVEKREVRGLCSNEVLSVGYLDIDGVYTHFDYSKQTKSTYNPHDYTLTVVQVDEGPQWSRTTTPSGERSREAAGPLLGRSIYGSQDQDYDQVYANLQYLPIDDELRQKEVDRLLAAGIPASQVQNVLWQKAVDARSRLASAGISLLTVEQARALEATDRSYPTDPRRPFVPVSPNHKFNEGDFRELLGDFTGLNDLQEGLLDGNYGQAAFGAGMTILTFTPGVVFKPLGKGLSYLGGKLFGETEQVLAAELGTLGKSGATGGRAGAAGAEGSPAFNAPWKLNPETSPFIPEPANPYNAGTHLGAGAGARAGDEAVPAILDYPRGELPWNAREVPVPREATLPPRAVLPDRPGGGYGTRPPWSRTDPAGIDGPNISDPRADPFGSRPRPGSDIPRRFPGEHGGSGPNPGAGTGVGLPKGRGLPPGITREGKPGGPTSWKNQQGKYTKKEPWDASQSDAALPGKLLDDPIARIPIDSLPAREQWMLGEVDAAQNASKTARDQDLAEIEAMLDSRQTKLMVPDGKGGSREATVKDFSGERIRKTLVSLDETQQLKLTDPESIRLAELAKSLREQRLAVSRLPEVRGEIGGDYYARQANIDIIHEGSGNYTADRLGVVTLPDGTRRVVLLEYKGGESATQFGSRQIDVGLDKPVSFEQGTLPYAQDEFLRPDSEALAALRAYDEKNGTDLAKQLLSGRQDFDYVLVHTEPNTGTITAYNVDPQTAKNFTLGQPDGPPPPSATPITATTGGIDGSPPNWLDGLALPDLRNLAAWLAPALPVIAPLVPRQADQSLVVNISMPAIDQRRVLDHESAAVLTHGAYIR